MADEKRNPLIGAFRAPMADKPPDAAAPVKPGEDKKPTEPVKPPADGKSQATGTAAAPTKPDEGKKPAEQDKAPADGKAQAAGAAAAPTKPGEGKKPAEQDKAPADGKTQAADAGTAAPTKPGEGKKPAEQDKAPADGKTQAAGAGAAAPAKPGEGKKPAEQDKAPADGKDKAAGAGAAAPPKPGEDKKSTEPVKPIADGKNKAAGADTAAPTKPGEGKKPTEPVKPSSDGKDKAADAGAAAPAKPGEGKKPADGKDKAAGDTGPEKTDEAKKDPNLRFVSLSKIVPLPGTYVKDEPRADYKDLIASIKKNGLEKAVILRQGEKGEFQLVDGFHRCKAMEQDGMLEVRADVYEMTLAEASRYRREHRQKPDLPIPGKLIPLQPPEPVKAAEPDKTVEAEELTEDGIPKNFKLNIVPENDLGKVVLLPIDQIDDFEDHPFPVTEDKEMWDLVESIKQFGILEAATVIPNEKKPGRYEMVAGHRRKRGSQLAGLTHIPAIVRNMDHDTAVIYMVDSNMKRENIPPSVKAKAYTMKLEAMKRKTGRRSKMEILSGKTPMRADEILAQQTGESRATIQRLTRLTKLEPELQQMVDDKKLPLNAAADISYLKPEEQKTLVDAIEKEGGKVPSGTQAAALKEESKKGTLTPEKIEKTVAPTKREESISLKVEFTDAELRPYFPEKTTTPGQAKRAMFEALDLRAKAMARQAEKAKGPAKPKKPEQSKGR